MPDIHVVIAGPKDDVCIRNVTSVCIYTYGLQLALMPQVMPASALQREHSSHLGSCMQVRLPYHVRVCVPCYKEDLEIVRRTVMAAYDAELPRGCSRTIYLCDDGKDPAKRKWYATIGCSVSSMLILTIAE